MPAGLPGATLAQNQGNPTQGGAVIMDPLSGPKASYLDARTIASWLNGTPVYADDDLNISTGGLCTGIGFGSPPILGNPAADAIGWSNGNFTDNYFPGRSLPSGSDAADSRLMYIGGGKSDATGAPTPFAVTAVAICMAGNGGSRDGGTSGFSCKLVTAITTIANGVAVETGFLNRSGVTITAGQSVFGSTINANTTPS